MNNVMNINDLPNEIIIKIFSLLSYNDIINFSITNKFINSIYLQNHEFLHKVFIKNNYGDWILIPSKLNKVILFDEKYPTVNFFKNLLSRNYSEVIYTLLRYNNYTGIHLLREINIDIKYYLCNIINTFIQSNDIHILDFLYKLGIDFSDKLYIDENGNTIFMNSLYLYYTSSLTRHHLLYDFNALNETNINIQNKFNKTVLSISIDNTNLIGKNDILKILTYSPNINHISTECYKTDFMLAIIKGCNTEILLRMLDLHPDMNAQDKDGLTPFMLALSKTFNYTPYVSEEVLLRMLDQPMDIQLKSKTGEDALMWLCKFYNPNITKKVIQKFMKFNPNVNSKDINGMTAIMKALKYKQSSSNDDDIFEILKKKYVSEYNYEYLITSLIHNGSDLDLTNLNNENALMICIKKRDRELFENIIELVLNNTQNINNKDIFGNTAILLALEQQFTYCLEDKLSVKFLHNLLSKNPCVNLLNNNNVSALTFTLSNMEKLPKSVCEKIINLSFIQYNLN
jgi:hypothetical protein